MSSDSEAGILAINVYYKLFGLGIDQKGWFEANLNGAFAKRRQAVGVGASFNGVLARDRDGSVAGNPGKIFQGQKEPFPILAGVVDLKPGFGEIFGRGDGYENIL